MNASMTTEELKELMNCSTSRKPLYRDKEHKEYYQYLLKKTRKQGDPYYESALYLLSLLPETREHINSLYDFKGSCIKIDGLTQGWQTSGTMKICRLAFNLYNGYHFDSDWETPNTDGAYTPYELFATPEAPYMLEAIRLRYTEYTRLPR